MWVVGFKEMAPLTLGYLLSLIAASATLLGWLVMSIKSKPSQRLIAWVYLFVAGAMILVSLLQLIPTAFTAGLKRDQVFLFILTGFILVLVISALASIKGGRRAQSSALLIAIALALHNLPEGSAPIAATLVDLPTGVITALLMALHNIPEGIAITAAALLAGFSPAKSFLLTLTATLAEISGASFIFLNQSLFLDQKSTGALLSFVAGIMLGICIKELLPFSIKTLVQGRRQ